MAGKPDEHSITPSKKLPHHKNGTRKPHTIRNPPNKECIDNLIALFKKLNNIINQMPYTEKIVIIDENTSVRPPLTRTENGYKKSSANPRKPEIKFINYSPTPQLPLQHPPRILAATNGKTHGRPKSGQDKSSASCKSHTSLNAGIPFQSQFHVNDLPLPEKKYEILYDSTVAPKIMYKCPDCDMRLSGEPQCREHLCDPVGWVDRRKNNGMARSADMVFRCKNEGCHRDFTSMQQLLIHQIHIEGKLVCCKVCNAICEGNDIYVSHMAENHPGSPVIMKSIHGDTMNVFDGLCVPPDTAADFYLDLWDSDTFGYINGRPYFPPSKFLPPLSVGNHSEEIYLQSPDPDLKYTVFRAEDFNYVIASLVESMSSSEKSMAWAQILGESNSMQVDVHPTHYGELVEVAKLLEQIDNLIPEPIRKRVRYAACVGESSA